MADPVDGPLVVSDRLVIASDELHWRFSRSSGPGGQGVNTADSRVELSFEPGRSRSVAGLPEALRVRLLSRVGPDLMNGVLVQVASEYRAQLRNRDAARRRLAQRLREALAPPPRARRRTRPTRGSIERRLRGKAVRSHTKAQRRRPTGD